MKPGYRHMNFDANDELLVRRYLLSSVTEEEREQVEKRLMSDDDFFRQIDLVEDELVEEYLDGELAGADRRRFEDTFLCAPERQHKLRFIRALRVYAADASQQAALQDRPSKHPWYQPILRVFDISRPVLAYSLASAVLVLMGGGAWLLVRMGGLENQISGLQARQQDRETEESRLRALLEKERSRADEIAGLLQQEQAKRTPTPLAMVSQPWFTVAPGAQRSAGPVQAFEIPKGALLVGLKLDLPENWKQTYRVVLLSPDKEILSRSNLKAAVSEKEITIGFSVPASDLPAGHCEIRLYGTGETEILETYSFRVIRN